MKQILDAKFEKANLKDITTFKIFKFKQTTFNLQAIKEKKYICLMAH